MAKILITGGSGLLGKKISELLLLQNHTPVWLSRQPKTDSPIQQFKWDIDKKFIDPKAFENVDTVIHLAGEGIIDKSWTSERKKELLDSRVKSSELLYESLIKSNTQLNAFVGCSAVGFYGATTSQEIRTELSSAGNDFLADTCVHWENSYNSFINANIRTSIIRVGIVLSNNAGAYQKMYKPFKFGFGSAVASGKQYFPWIHIHDVANLFLYAALNKSMFGIFNAVASPTPTNKQFSEALSVSFNHKLMLPNVPKFLVKLALGERAITLTEGLQISNEKIKSQGFKFEFDDLPKALLNLASNAK